MSQESSKESSLTSPLMNARVKFSQRHWLIRPFLRLSHFVKKQSKVDPFRFVVVLLFITLASGMGAFAGFNGYKQHSEYDEINKFSKMTLTEFKSALDKKTIASITDHQLNNGSFMSPSLINLSEIVLKDGSHKVMTSTLLSNETVQKILYEHGLSDGIDFKRGLKHGENRNLIMDLLSTIFTIGLLVLLLLFFQRAMSDILVGKNFNPKTSNEDVDFTDIVGYEEVKREFREVISQMKKAKHFSKQGIKAPKGILLTGSPGVGKTMFAKALANECGANFMYATGSDFVELYVGVGARRARSMFANARVNSPTVIFIDEIDALGSRDAYGMDSERLSTINQMLAEMDGFSENEQVLIVGATNYPDKLDPAMLRPGRFDKKINIPQPDASTREGILKYYLKDVEVADDVDLKNFALRSGGMSGAELKNWVAEAKNLALRDSDGHHFIVDKKKMDQAQEILLLGFSERAGNETEKERVAIHELGHALIGHLLNSKNFHVDKVALTGRGGALGFTMNRPLEDKSIYLESELRSQIASLLAGRAAELVYFGEVSSGAGDDLMRANEIARKMVCDLGMGSHLPLLTFKINPNIGQSLPVKVEEDIALVLSEQYQAAIDLLNSHRHWLEETKEQLMTKGMLDHDELFAHLKKDEERASVS